MSTNAAAFERVKSKILSAHKNVSLADKIVFYNTWAVDYEQDVAALDYRAPKLAADFLSAHFPGDREAAVVLDVACGTGLVAKELKQHGFGRFVGIDGSEQMLESARETNVYQDLKQCMLGEEALPVQWGSFDVVVIVGALSAGQVPPSVVRDLCKAAKAGGFICLTTRANKDNLQFKTDLELLLRQMEEEELWSCVSAVRVQDWERAVSEEEEGYISGVVYLYKKQQAAGAQPQSCQPSL